jgi:hypothetical protein
MEAPFFVYLPHELNVLDLLNERFDNQLNHNERFDVFDFSTQDGKTHIEYKARECSISQYPTTIIGFNKIDEAIDGINEDPTRRYIFVFHFIPDDKYVFYEFQKRDLKRFRVSLVRFKKALRPHFNIPISSLRPLDELVI